MVTTRKKNWTAMWGNAISITHRKPENYARNLTLRYPIKAMLSGTALRITLDNFCGLEDVTIHKVSLAPSDSKGNLTGAATLLHFDGNEEVTLAKGESKTSDALEFYTVQNEYFSISIYLKDFTEMRSGVIITGPLSSGYFAIGDHTMTETLPINESNKTDCFYFLSTVEVLPENDAHTIVCYGDSITAQDWPDYLMEQVLTSYPEGNKNAVIRRAASGTRILRQYENIVYDSYGLKGSIRFPHEVPVAGADVLIIQHGINDIIHPVGVEVNKFRPWSDMPTLDDLIAGITDYIEQARKYGYKKIYLGTLLPIRGWRTDAPFREELRQQFNAWMRSTPLADGCIDFDLAVRAEANPAAFHEGYDSGDHLHPSAAAYKVMGLEAFRFLSEAGDL